MLMNPTKFKELCSKESNDSFGFRKGSQTKILK